MHAYLDQVLHRVERLALAAFHLWILGLLLVLLAVDEGLVEVDVRRIDDELGQRQAGREREAETRREPDMGVGGGANE